MVAFGVAALVAGLGVLFILIGLALLGILGRLAPVATETNEQSPTVAPAAT